jgi:tetratricopeptide (TPR) repeat protein
LALCFEEQGLLEKSIKSYQIAYKSSKQNILLYHLARNYDLYYKDKSTALSYYERYLAMNDSDHIPLLGYSKKRISELKEIIHFDTGNTNNSLD